jgi:hypothetical protein
MWQQTITVGNKWKAQLRGYDGILGIWASERPYTVPAELVLAVR